nr:hypothetical protein [Tanacetum cinerariifolium]
RIEESVNATLEAKVLTRSSHSSRTSYVIEADLSEMELKKILIEKMEGNKECTILKQRREDDDQEGPSVGSDRGYKRQKEGGEHASASTPSETATRVPAKLPKGLNLDNCLPVSLLFELLDTPIDFSNFIMHRLNVDTLTPELLAGPTYELMRGSCKSLTELEYHLEEVYKATTDQLDWVRFQKATPPRH